MKFFHFIPLLFAFLFFSGCLVGEEEVEDARRACMVLTSHSSSSIPECYSQGECTEKVEKNFFSFNQKVFSNEVRLKLHSFKNHLASSWLYYHKSLQTAQKLNLACSTEDYSSLPALTNELHFFLSRVVEEIDYLSEDSFSAIALQKNFLVEEETEKIKEEKVFDDLILLSQNLNDLASSDTESDSFVSFYLRRVEELNSRLLLAGFEPVYLRKATLVNVIDFYDEDLLQQLPETHFFIPMLKNTYLKIFSLVAGNFNMVRSLEALNAMPSFSLFDSFNSFIGTDSSVAAEFGSFFHYSSLHLDEVRSSKGALRKEIAFLLAEAGQKVDSIDPDFYSHFDQNFLFSLRESLSSDSSIAAAKFDSVELSSFHPKAADELFFLEQRFTELNSRAFLDEISLGEELSELKSLSAELALFIEKTDFFGNTVIEDVRALCNARVNQIENDLDGIQFDFHSPTELKDLRALIEAKVFSFKSAEPKEKLLLCKEVNQFFSEFNEGRQNSEILHGTLNSQFAECMDFLGKMFSLRSDLTLFQNQFSSLKYAKNSAPLDYATLNNCLNLQKQVQGFIHSQPEILFLEGKFGELSSLTSSINASSAHFPEIFSSSQLDSLNSRFKKLDDHFAGTHLSLNESIGITSDLSESVSGLHSDALELYREALIKHFKENFEFKALTPEHVEFNKPFSATALLSFQNPFNFSFASPLSFSLPLIVPDFNYFASSPNVLNVSRKDGELFVDLNNVPLSGTWIEFNFPEAGLFPDEEIELLYLDQFKAFVKKTLSFSSPFKLNSLNIVQPLLNPLEPFELIAVFNGKEIPSFLSGGKAFFELQKIGGSGKVELFFSVSGPIAASVNLTESRQLDQNTFSMIYSIKVTNRLPVKAEKVSLKLPFDLNSGLVEEFELTDSRGKKIKTTPLKNNSFSFGVSGLLPNQSISLNFFLKVRDFSAFWNKTFRDLEEGLSELKFSEFAEVREKAVGIEERLLELESQTDFSSISSAKAISSLGNETAFLSARSLELLAQKDSFFELRERLLKLAEESASFLEKADEFGFPGAFSLRDSLDGASEKLNEAESRFSAEEFGKANEALFAGISSLEPAPDLSQAISSKAESVWSEFRSLQEPVSFLGFSGNLSIGKKIPQTRESLLSFISSGNLLQAGNSLMRLEQETRDFNSAAFTAKQSFNEKVNGKILGLGETISSPQLMESISLLKEIFSVEEIPEKYFPPIGAERVKAIELKLGSIPSLSLQKQVEEFRKAFKEGETEKAFMLAQKIDKPLSDALSEANALQNEASNALSKLKEDAAFFLSRAEEVSGTDPGNEELYFFFSSARKRFEEGGFLESIAFSEKAAGLFFASPPEAFSVPAAAFPLALLAAAALFYRLYGKKLRKKEPKPRPVPSLRK